jgi:hypothetical protein
MLMLPALQESQRTPPKSLTLAILYISSYVKVRLITGTTRSTREKTAPEPWLEQKARERFKENSTCCPDKVHIHPLCNEDLPLKEELVV